ncbi:MAG: glycoside hydrolase family protein, partial [Alphaproteobacteria bacterium]
AAQEFPKWVWAAGQKLPGLIRRRHDEMAVFQGE